MIANANSIVQHVIQVKWNINTSNGICQCEGKNYRECKKDYSQNHSIYIGENSKYLQIFLTPQ